MSVDLVTFGCRLNAYESEVIRRQAQAVGLADTGMHTIVVNTCAVTAEATRQARQAIRRLRRERPDARIVVTGCAAPVAPASFRDMAEGDRVLGNGAVPMGEAVDQVRALIERGYREVVLTGVDLTSYGAGLPGTPRLGTLVKQILKHVPGLERLRLSSIDSIEADRDLLDALADDARMMPHLHLSLQAGDDLILKRMKRRHRRADAIAFCAQVRRLRPDVAFGGDIIAGFPTQSEAMFARSRAS